MAGDAPLADLRVVERASGLAGSYAGFLLAALGAEVVKVEPPGAARTVPGAAVMERGKRSATLDLARAADAACWEALVAGADAVLSDESMPRVPAVEGLVCCRVSAWGGASDLPSDEALVAAATGVHAMQWSWSRRPVWLVTPMVAYMTGMLAALGVAAAVFARRRGAPAGEPARLRHPRDQGLRAARAGPDPRHADDRRVARRAGCGRHPVRAGPHARAGAPRSRRARAGPRRPARGSSARRHLAAGRAGPFLRHARAAAAPRARAGRRHRGGAG